MTDDRAGFDQLFETDVADAEVTPRRPHLVQSPAGPLALVRDGERVVAVDAWCPHLDGPLWEGSAAQGEIACPWHGWRYSLATGECTWAPRGDAEEAAETSVRVFPTQIGPNGRVTVVLPAG
ncbi:MAG: Rieske (2Fe-2S) protein [Planctomycetota bacterium]